MQWVHVNLVIALCSQHQAETSGSGIVANTEKPLDIPKELWMMVDYLFRNAIKQVRKNFFSHLVTILRHKWVVVTAKNKIVLFILIESIAALLCICIIYHLNKWFWRRQHNNYLFIFLMLQEDIFQQPGLRSEFADIRDCLDTGMPDSLRILQLHSFHWLKNILGVYRVRFI